MVPNHEKKEDYYVHPCLSQLIDELLLQKTGATKSFPCKIEVSMSSIPMRRVCLWCLIMKRKEIIMCINVCPH